MSRWLQNVGQFLEKLDDQAGRVVALEQERRQEEGHDEDAVLPPIDRILAARGLEGVAQEDDEDDDALVAEEGWDELEIPDDSESPLENEDLVAGNPEPVAEDSAVVEVPQETKEAAPIRTTAVDDEDEDKGDSTVAKQDDDAPMDVKKEEVETTKTSEEGPTPSPDTSSPDDKTETMAIHASQSSPTLVSPEGPDEPAPEKVVVEATKTTAAPRSRPPPAPQSAPGPFHNKASSSPAAPTAPAPPRRDAVDPNNNATRLAQKEARTLRRHVVSLNAQLETAESEIQAQRNELERAADRMHKDLARHKQEREADKTRVAAELKLLKTQHEDRIKEMRQRADAQVEAAKRQLLEVESQRMQEGGDWSKDMADAVQRERDMAQKVHTLEEDRATLVSQVSTLQAQQVALEQRVASLVVAADTASERERQAEVRLDEALSLHARQLGQRQAREVELEQTVSELGVALVAARNKGTDQAPGDMTAQESPHDYLLQGMEQDVESLQGQLDSERQGAQALERELRAMSKEQTKEAAVAQKRQQQHDRQVQDLMQTVSQLKLQLRDKDQNSDATNHPNHQNAQQEDLKQIKRLSEEVVRQRETLSGSSSEIATLRSRLKVALDRATKAETALEKASSSSSSEPYSSDSLYVDHNIGMRRRRKRADGFAVSLKSALLDDAASSPVLERVAVALDTLDQVLYQSGRLIRSNPFARLFFAFYLFFLHVWTSSLLFFHAHNLDTTHCGMMRENLPIGPEVVAKQGLAAVAGGT